MVKGPQQALEHHIGQNQEDRG